MSKPKIDAIYYNICNPEIKAKIVKVDEEEVVYEFLPQNKKFPIYYKRNIEDFYSFYREERRNLKF